MFTCSNAPRIFGELDYEVGLIERIEKRNLKRIWNIALMSAVFNKDINWDTMYDTYRIKYTETKAYKKAYSG
jgi:hypothetical protein